MTPLSDRLRAVNADHATVRVVVEWLQDESVRIKKISELKAGELAYSWAGASVGIKSAADALEAAAKEVSRD